MCEIDESVWEYSYIDDKRGSIGRDASSLHCLAYRGGASGASADWGSPI